MDGQTVVTVYVRMHVKIHSRTDGLVVGRVEDSETEEYKTFRVSNFESVKNYVKNFIICSHILFVPHPNDVN